MAQKLYKILDDDFGAKGKVERRLSPMQTA